MRILLALFVLLSVPSCKGGVPQVIHVIEDCITKERPAIVDLLKKWLDATPSLAEIEAEALSKGLHVGGCALHEFVNTKLTPADGNHALPPDEGWALRALVAKYRSDAKIAGNTVFKTPQGSLGAD